MLQVEDYKVLVSKAMATEDSDNEAFEKRLHDRMARSVSIILMHPLHFRFTALRFHPIKH